MVRQAYARSVVQLLELLLDLILPAVVHIRRPGHLLMPVTGQSLLQEQSQLNLHRLQCLLLHQTLRSLALLRAPLLLQLHFIIQIMKQEFANISEVQ